MHPFPRAPTDGRGSIDLLSPVKLALKRVEVSPFLGKVLETSDDNPRTNLELIGY